MGIVKTLLKSVRKCKTKATGEFVSTNYVGRWVLNFQVGQIIPPHCKLRVSKAQSVYFKLNVFMLLRQVQFLVIFVSHQIGQSVHVSRFFLPIWCELHYTTLSPKITFQNFVETLNKQKYATHIDTPESNHLIHTRSMFSTVSDRRIVKKNSSH